MKMIMNPPPVAPCEGKARTSSDTDTVSTGVSPASSIEKQLSSCSFSSEKDRAVAPASPAASTPQRRSIFNSYWQKNSASSSFRDDNGDDHVSPGGRDVRRSPKFEPSYLGVYSFAPPSPLLSPKLPPLSPISSTDSLTLPSSYVPPRPKSILRRHGSVPRPTAGRPRSVSCVGPESNTRTQFDIAPPPFQDDTYDLSKASKLKHQHSLVHFDPTITVRECVGDDVPRYNQESNWFTENELRSFLAETVNLCQSSAVNAVKTYSVPAVKKAYETAHEVGVKSPISHTYPECRALFADPVLHASDEDSIVHDGSKKFFKIMSKEVQNVLIVDNSPTTLKLFSHMFKSMFPHVQIDKAMSGEDALDKIQVDSKRPGLNYDLIIAEERLQQRDNADVVNESLDLTGSELLRLLNEMETSASCQCGSSIKHVGCIKPRSSRVPSRRSLKIGVSVSLGEDCESLQKQGGADFLWSKPPPKPSNGLRNQVLNALLSKRGKSVFICGC